MSAELKLLIVIVAMLLALCPFAAHEWAVARRIARGMK